VTYEAAWNEDTFDQYLSNCPDDCIVCEGFVSNFREFSLIDGDLYIVGE
jgi:hypothetical protein